MMRKLLASLTLILVLSIVISAAAGQTVAAEKIPVEIKTVETGFSMSGADNNDALLQQYINRVLSGQSGAKKRRSAPKAGIAGSKLTGMDRKIYDALLTEIEYVANGQRESTEFSISAEALGLQMYTAADLGLDSLIVETSPGHYAFANEAYQAVTERAEYDGQVVLNALLSDCPYDLYWYDKVYWDEQADEYAYMSSTRFKYEYDEDDELWLGIDQVVILLRVAADYQKSGDPYKVDTALPTRVQNAAQNITQVLSMNAGLDDFSKLRAYKNKICELTDYNRAAADDNSTPYGDPWQLIWVFDGVANTKVVCEGYSKAFKYLCDCSEFEGKIQCILVTGDMNGEGHMWNIVKMPNEKNYMVDVTNSDIGPTGSETLFLKKYTTYSDVYHQYNFGSISYVYDSETMSTYNYEDWLLLSDENYTEIPVSITLSDFESDSELDDGTVICGYPYTLPTECPFTPPQWCTFIGWYMQNEEPPVVHQAGESVRIMEDAEFTVMWQENLPTFDTPDFVLPQHIQTIGSEAFSGADPSVVKIPALSSGSQTIQDSAFAGCTHLRQIFIPASVTSIGAHAFDNCAEGLIIFGETGSAAENYASANEILFAPVTTAP